MKKATRGVLCFAALAFVMSCASAPAQKPATEPAAQPAAQPATQPQGAASLPEAELAKAKALQQQADAYSLGDYVPDDYAAASRDLAAGQQSYGKDNAASKKSLDRSIDGFTTVISKGGALYLAKLQAQTDAARKAAIEAKAPVAVKDDYANADAVALRAVREKNAGDIQSAAADFPQATTLFTTATVKAREKKAAADAAIAAAAASQENSKKTATDADTVIKTGDVSAADGNGGGK